MRTPHWLTPLAICFLVALSGAHAMAQYPGMPGHTGIHTQGMPPGAYNPYPRISPFEQAYSRTYNRGGTWFNDSRGAAVVTNRNWFMNVDFIKSEVRSLTGLVGDPNSQSYYDLIYTTLVANESQQYADDFGFFNYFDAVNARAISDLTSTGLRISGGFLNQNASGFEFDVSWNRESNAKYNARQTLESGRYDAETQRRLGRGPGFEDNSRLFRRYRDEREVLEALLTGPDFFLTDIFPLDPIEVFEANLLNLNGLPLDNGSFGGVTQPYDMDYILTHSHQSFGTNFGYLMTPILEGGLTVRPYIGGRYLYIQEGFGFDGVDSNTLYDGDNNLVITADYKLHSHPDGVDDDGDFIIDNAGFDETNAAVVVFNQLQGEFIRSFLKTEVTTHLAGPEIALRYDLGDPIGRGFSLSGKTKVGLMVNHENIEMRGDNIGAIMRFDPLVVAADTGNVHTEIFDITDEDPTPNAFSDSKQTTHASPLFEQSFNAELPIFDRVPGLNRVRQLQGARFRVGYSWLYIGEVASPNQSILWQANPQAGIFPKIRLKRDEYSISTVNFGIDWAF